MTTTERIRRVAKARMPTAHGVFTAYGYAIDGREHVALVHGDLSNVQAAGDSVGEAVDGAVLARVHSECLTGDVFGSLRCDCGPQLTAALAAIAAEGRGVVVYLRGHEGRGIGLLAKLAAYTLQDAGHDTVDANLALGLPAEARDYRAGALILTDLGVRTVRLLTNNPAKITGLAAYGITVAGRVALHVSPNPENAQYLRTKRTRLGHHLPAEAHDA
ncbi:GTP cyclohydrolase II [Actinopolymorpha sp. B11F2]|uniref:GTP cyclohydrolase II n=1 Tax=Actinopolymorpha sp. B11F2 TaxID=3160862 RepID=UPI0032E46154